MNILIFGFLLATLNISFSQTHGTGNGGGNERSETCRDTYIISQRLVQIHNDHSPQEKHLKNIDQLNLKLERSKIKIILELLGTNKEKQISRQICERNNIKPIDNSLTIDYKKLRNQYPWLSDKRFDRDLRRLKKITVQKKCSNKVHKELVDFYELVETARK